MDALLVITTFPDAASAQAMARSLVAARLAACVSVQAPQRACYRWQGAIEEGEEYPVHIKTTALRYAALETALRAQHPYTTPEIIALPIVSGGADYLRWLNEETRA